MRYISLTAYQAVTNTTEETNMILASRKMIDTIEDASIYGDAAVVNRAVIAMAAGRVPCYAIKGKRTRVKWVSVGSSAVIGRGVARDFLARVGVDIERAEAA